MVTEHMLKISACTTGRHKCAEGSKCTVVRDGSYICRCPLGRVGEFCETGECWKSFRKLYLNRLSICLSWQFENHVCIGESTFIWSTDQEHCRSRPGGPTQTFPLCLQARCLVSRQMRSAYCPQAYHHSLSTQSGWLPSRRWCWIGIFLYLLL